ncbi:unnamed protein product [Paramecium primaurelia]|uniref:Uncharacterized protein n=1 Tax=Paramecium primaurelia TaxID=5886 RepID=A0A8S1N2N6_PARPR|nr:unnamed protein product [Paramecium primaurelia]
MKLSKQQVRNIVKKNYQAFDPKRPIFTQVMLKQQETIIDDGILFRNENSQQFLNNYEINNQKADIRFIPQAIQYMAQITQI